MTTNAPHIPVKIITALWFSIVAIGGSPKIIQNKNRKNSGKSQGLLLHSHGNPAVGRVTM